MSFEGNVESGRSNVKPERLVGMATAAVAAATGAGVVGPTQEADAAIVVHEINQVVPANVDGLYVNILTGATGSSGLDVGVPYLNPYGSSTTTLSWWGGGSFRGVNTGNFANENSALPVGFVVGAGIPNAPGAGPGTPRFNTSTGITTSWAAGDPGDFSLNSLNYFGFRFQAGSNTHYGWGSIDIGADLSSRTLRKVAFESTPGASIQVGAVPEPSSLALLAGGMLGLTTWRRSRKEASTDCVA